MFRNTLKGILETSRLGFLLCYDNFNCSLDIKRCCQCRIYSESNVKFERDHFQVLFRYADSSIDHMKVCILLFLYVKNASSFCASKFEES